MGLLSKAEEEFRIYTISNKEEDDLILPFKKPVLEIVEIFAKQGHANSAYIATEVIVNAIKSLLLNKAISPLTGEDDEWIQHGGDMDIYQNKRNTGVFKEGKDGQAYYLDAIIWCHGNDDDTYFGCSTIASTGQIVESKQYIKSFPFEPKTFYIDRNVADSTVKNEADLDPVKEYYDFKAI